MHNVDHKKIQLELESLIRRKFNRGKKTDDKVIANKEINDADKVSESKVVEAITAGNDTSNAIKNKAHLPLEETDNDVSLGTRNMGTGEKMGEAAFSSPLGNNAENKEVVTIGRETQAKQTTIEIHDSAVLPNKSSIETVVKSNNSARPANKYAAVGQMISMIEYRKLKRDYDAALADIAAQNEIIKASVTNDVYKRLEAELQSAKVTIAQKEKEIKNSVSLEAYKKMQGELESANGFMTSQKSRLDNSVSKSDYKNVTKELEAAESMITRLRCKNSDEYTKLRASIGGIKKELESSKEMVALRETTIGKLRRDIERKDKTIERLEMRIQHLEDKAKASGKVLDSSTMQAKIEDAKKRQEALREKFMSPHRLKKKQSVTDSLRDFDALALSPAGRRSRSHSKKSKSKPDLPPARKKDRDSRIHQSDAGIRRSRRSPSPFLPEGSTSKKNERREMNSSMLTPRRNGKSTVDDATNEVMSHSFDKSSMRFVAVTDDYQIEPPSTSSGRRSQRRLSRSKERRVPTAVEKKEWSEGEFKDWL